MLGDRLHDQLFINKYPTRTTNEYNYHWRNTEKGQEYKKRTNQRYYLRHSKSPVITREGLEKKRKYKKV